MSWARWLELAEAEVARTIGDLPDDLRPRAAQLPVTYERGTDEPDTLGLFVGGEFAIENEVELPSQIILYLENIRDMVEGDEEEFCEEVRLTYIHELGHYLGLNEEELDDRGLL